MTIVQTAPDCCTFRRTHSGGLGRISVNFTEIKAVLNPGSPCDYKDVLLLATLHSQKPFFVTTFVDPLGVGVCTPSDVENY